MNAEPRVVVDPYDVDARLRELGLVRADVTEALTAGASAMALCFNTNHPPIFGGLSFWAEAVNVLRNRKMQEGWSKSDARNYSTVVSPDRAIQIAIARGDDWTGRENAPDGKPSTLHPKGSATQLAVEVNSQLTLFDEPPVSESASDSAVATLVLLHFMQKHAIRCELSRPNAISPSGFVEGWEERIIIGQIDLDPDRISLPDEPPVAPDVLIRRRA